MSWTNLENKVVVVTGGAAARWDLKLTPSSDSFLNFAKLNT